MSINRDIVVFSHNLRSCVEIILLRKRGYFTVGGFLALLAALGYTVYNILMRRGLMEENPGSIWDTRLIVSFATMVIFFIGAFIAELLGYGVLQDFKDLSLMALLFILLSGTFGALIGAFFLTMAVAQIGASQTSVLSGGTNPIFTTLLGIVFLGQVPDLIGIIAVLVIVGGIICVGYHGHEGTIALLEKTRLAGGVIALLAGLSFALAQVAKGEALNLGATPNTAFVIGQTIPFVISIIICLKKSGGLAYLKDISRESLYCYLGASIGIVLGVYCLLAAFTFIPVWQAVAILGIQPLIAVFLSWIFLKKADKVSLRLIYGAVLVTFGVVILNVY